MPGTPLSSRCTRKLGVALLTLAMTIVACDKGSPIRHTADAEPPREIQVSPPGDPPAKAAASAIDADIPEAPPPASTGTVVGTIKFGGAAPAMPALDRSRDSNCPQDEAHASWVVVAA